MLFHVHMIIKMPHDLPVAVADDIKAREKAYAQDLQKQGKWVHLWRIVGEYANYSVFDVESNDELQKVLSGLPLFPFMEIKVTPLAKHPSAIV
ncbi:MAG: muconolactone D-isomerase [Burkholderiales bacterium]|jgi:muconolactone D-isomerase|nr:Muconolactone isomerase [Burkholderia sp.]